MTGNLKPLDDLGAHFPHRGPSVSLAYAQAGLFVYWLQGRYGPETVVSLVREVQSGIPFADAFEQVVGASVTEVQAEWEESLEPSGSWMLLLSDVNLHWTLLTLLFLLVAWRKREQKKEQLAEMATRESYAFAEEVLEEDGEQHPPVLH
jgi:hypothetical protein